MPAWLNDLIYALGGLGIGSLIIFLIQRHDQRKGLEESFKKLEKDVNKQFKKLDEDFTRKFRKLEKDGLRTQILLFMYNYDPKDESELMTAAEHYFKDLKGDWYMTPKFNRFIQENNIAKPDWLE